jgi:hypothetical protein
LKIRFQADNDLNRDIVTGVLRHRPAVDFDANPTDGIEDTEVLALAAKHDRILVSHDVRTMPHAFAAFRMHSSSPGVLLVPQLWPISAAIDQLIVVWELSQASEWRNRICYLPTLTDFVRTLSR